jgi:hypothetical protein
MSSKGEGKEGRKEEKRKREKGKGRKKEGKGVGCRCYMEERATGALVDGYDKGASHHLPATPSASAAWPTFSPCEAIASGGTIGRPDTPVRQSVFDNLMNKETLAGGPIGSKRMLYSKLRQIGETTILLTNTE